MKRRQFITLLGGAAGAWPMVTWAQQPAMPLIGFLRTSSRDWSRALMAGFRRGLAHAGFEEGRNVRIDYRWGPYEQLASSAIEFVRGGVAAIVVRGNVPARAALAATKTIPIVFITGDDPMTVGLVTSMSRPSGNATGISMNAGALPTKRLELLHELVPTATTVGILVNASNANAAADVVAVESAAQRIGLQVVIASIAEAETDFNGVFEALTRANASALLVNTDAFFSSRRDQLVALAFSYGIPTVYSIREFVEVGGLASYGNDLADAYRHAGVYVGPILKGARPGDLPVLQPTKFDLVINLKAAKVFGIEISPTLLARADEVIE